MKRFTLPSTGGTDKDRKGLSEQGTLIYIDDITTSTASAHWLKTHEDYCKFRYKKSSAAVWGNWATVLDDNFTTMFSLTENTEYTAELRYVYGANESVPITVNGLLNAPTSPLPDPQAVASTTSATFIDVSTGTVTLTGHTIGFSGDVDCFYFQTTVAKPNFKITLDQLPLDYDMEVTRLNLPGTLLNNPFHPQNPNTESEILKFATASAHTYFIRIDAYRHGEYSTAYAYRLKVETGSTPFGKTTAEDEVVSTSPNAALNIYPNPATTHACNYKQRGSRQGYPCAYINYRATRLGTASGCLYRR